MTDENGKVFDDSQTAHMFNEYFSNIGPILAAKVGTPIHKFEHYLPKSPLASAVFECTCPK